MIFIFRSFRKLLTNLNYIHNERLKSMFCSLVPLPSVRGMKQLNRELFKTKITVPYLQFQTEVVAPEVIPILKKYFLKLPQFKAIQRNNNLTTIYLNPNKIKNFEDIPENERNSLLTHAKFFSNGDLTLNYDNFTVNQILKAIMPENLEIPSSFSRVGHIIHLNLRNYQLPFAKIIGQVYLDKIPNVTTVVNKTSNIDTSFRFFNMEVLIGNHDTIVTAKENKCTFTFDFAKVYWNPRLSTEHQIIIDLIKPNDIMYDVFAGVGPFAIPVAKNGRTVLANDLNPESYKWLQKNASINKIKKNLEFYNLDGREFLKNNVKIHLLHRRKNNLIGSEHIVMNLPASAVDFLEVFHDWMSIEEENLIYLKPLYIHVYCFVKLQENEDAVVKAKNLVEAKLGYSLRSDRLKDIHYVKNVAPNKEMMRVSFLLMRAYMENGESMKKKLKTDNDYNVTSDFVGQNGSQTGSIETEQERVQTQGSSNNESEESTKN